MSKPYNNTLYLNLLHSCKLYGYKKLSKGKPRVDELLTYIYGNIDKREPIPPRTKPAIKYDTTYYKELVSLARWNGFIFKKVGKISIKTFIDFLKDKNVVLPIKLKRIELPPKKRKNKSYHTKNRCFAEGFTAQASLIRRGAEPSPVGVKTNYDISYYKNLKSIARQNGYVNNTVGTTPIDTFIEYLEAKGVELPEETFVITSKRVTLSQCKTKFSKLCFKAKSLGYRQHKSGRPSYEQINDYISKNI